MKRLLQHLAGALFFLMILTGMAGTACAEEQSKELMVLPRQANIVVSIAYETEMPDITLISPDGTAYSEAAGNVRVDHSDKTAFYFLPDALAGQWLIRFDKKSNPTITADYAEYTPDLTIESLTLKGVSGNQAEIAFNASYPKDITYNYVVYAVILDENRNVTGQKELDHGTARAGREENRRVSLNNLSSYENYYLELEVYLKEYGLETNDTRITDQNFGYVNSHQPEAMTGVKVEIDPAKLVFTMDWSDYKVYCDQYLAAFYTEASPDTPVAYQNLESDYTSAIFDLPADVHSLTVELTYLKNGVASTSYRRQIDWEKGLTLSIDTPENTSSVQAVITYETDVQRNAVVTVNDSQQQVVLSGSDSFSVQLEEFSNEVSVRCSLDDMTDVIYRKSVYSDRIAPILRFYEKVDAISVAEDHFLLTGETEPGCKLTVNGTEYPLDESGSFSVDLPLEKDENVFSVISSDPAGNQSAQNVTIYHGDVPAAAAMASGQSGDDNDMGYLPLFFTMLIGMSVVLAVILTGAVLGKRRTLVRGVMTVTTLRNVALLLTLFLSAAAAFARLLADRARQSAESLAFIRAAQRSPQEAHNMLKEYESLHRVFLVLAIAAGVCLVIAVLFMVLNRVIKKKKSTPPGLEHSGGPNPEPQPLPSSPDRRKKPAGKRKGKADMSQPVRPQVDAPQPVKPQAAAPQPTKPQAAAPQPAKPQVAASQPAKSQTATPQPAKLQATAPQPAKPKAAVPQPTKPQTAAPQPVKPQVAAPQPAKPKAAAPQPTKPSTAAPQPTKPSTAAPQPAKPQATVPQPAKPKAAAPQPTKPSTAAPQPAKPQATAPQPAKPQAAAPQPVKPQAAATQPAKPQSAPPAKAQPSSAPAADHSPAAPTANTSGTPESANAGSTAVPAVFCPHCGKLVKKSKAMFCPFCGKSLRP